MITAKTRRNILVSLALLLLLFLLFLVWWFLRPEEEVLVIPPVVVEEIKTEPKTPSIQEEKQKVVQEERTNTASLQSASKTFAERYGSYSTEAEFANLRDVLPLMSASFARSTQAFIDGATPASEYYGVTTHVISIEVNAVDETAGTATVTVTTQREEAKKTIQDSSVRYSDLVLTFVKEDDAWKVSSAKWE